MFYGSAADGTEICRHCETGLISDHMYPQSCMPGNYTGLSVILRGKFKGVKIKISRGSK